MITIADHLNTLSIADYKNALTVEAIDIYSEFAFLYPAQPTEIFEEVE